MLEVTIYNEKGVAQTKFDEDDEFDYVSLVSTGTYGPPALIAPARNRDEARAAVEDRVLYINTGLVPMFSIMRTTP